MSIGPFASSETLGEYLDMSVHTIRQWVKDGKIPRNAYIKVGNTYRFHVGAVQDALINFDKRKELTDEEREALALEYLKQVDVVATNADTPASSYELEQAERELQNQVDGTSRYAQHGELNIDPELDAMLNDNQDQ